jgi:hypothetical protein
MKRHIVRASLTAAALVGAAGCQSKPAAQNVQAAAAGPQQQQPLVDAQAKPAAPAFAPAPAPTTEASIGSAEALKLKAQNWASEMTPLMMTRRERKPVLAPEPSDVDFLDPSEFRLGPAQPAVSKSARKAEAPVQVIPVVEPVVVANQSYPNQSVAISSAAGVADKPVTGTGGANVNRLVADSPGERSAAPVAKDATRDALPTAGDLDLAVARNLRENARDVWAQFDFQLLQFLKDRPTPQLEVMAKLTNEDRELITAVMDGLTNFRNGIRSDNNMLMSRKVRPLLDLADRVRAQADLIIPTLSLCTRVEGFGVYEPVEPARFQAMKEVVLYTETGLPVWQDKTENIPDLARNRRHDFFVVKKTKFPGNITIGRYLLKVTIVDQQASRVAEATIPVQFVAQQ